VITDYILHLADNALILGQRNSEWCGHGPVLEQDIAITNISLDLIGQARSLYQYAAQRINSLDKAGDQPATEDTLAYLRDIRDFKNCLLCELPNGDWGQTILRQFFFSSYQLLLYQHLQQSTDTTLSAIAEKSLKEVTYHVRWSSEWVIRLGDGTEESHDRMQQAIDALWMYTGELFVPAAYEKETFDAGIGVDLPVLQPVWETRINEVFSEATLASPGTEQQPTKWMQTGGKEGIHTEYLGYVLAEMQYMQRAYPGCEW
jgi:ring-1,2-phenylacetyl-CoA epoxidase subunit PaaC